MMHNTDYTETVVYPELAERMRGFPNVETVSVEEFRHWAALVRLAYATNYCDVLHLHSCTPTGAQGLKKVHAPAAVCRVNSQPLCQHLLCDGEVSTAGLIAQAAQYSFVFWNSTEPNRAQRRFLFPMGDLANHKCALALTSGNILVHHSPEVLLNRAFSGLVCFVLCAPARACASGCCINVLGAPEMKTQMCLVHLK